MPSPQMHDPNNLMRTSGFVSVQHPVRERQVAAFFTPSPPLSTQHLGLRLSELLPWARQGGE